MTMHETSPFDGPPGGCAQCSLSPEAHGPGGVDDHSFSEPGSEPIAEEPDEAWGDDDNAAFGDPQAEIRYISKLAEDERLAYVAKLITWLTPQGELQLLTYRRMVTKYERGSLCSAVEWDAILAAEQGRRATERARKAEGERVHAQRAHGGMPTEYALSDALMADHLASRCMDGRLCFSPAFGWMQWDGKVWEAVDESIAIEHVRVYLRGWVASEIRDPSMGARPDELTTLLSRTRVNAITALAKGRTSVDGKLFDADPDVLTVENGVVDLRTGALYRHDHTRYLTTYAPTRYVPGARHADVDVALSVMAPAVVDYTNAYLGQGITGHPPDDDRLRLLHGEGSNGKSSLIAGLIAALGGTTGRGAIRQLSDSVLLGDKDAKEERMALKGARLVFVEELPEGAHLNVTQLKKSVGTPTVTSRHLYRKEVTWASSHSIILTTNYKPQVAETDWGTWRRLARVPFPFKYVSGEPAGPNERRGDSGLKDRMAGREQREALMAWLVAGAVRWYQSGRKLPEPPAEVVAATEEWRAESDMVVRYWAERLVADPRAHIIANELTDDLNGFLKDLRKTAWADNTIANRFGKHDCTVRAGVEKRQVSQSLSGLSRPANRDDSSWSSAWAPVKPRYMAWVGVRFVTEADLVERERVEEERLFERPH